MFWKDYIVKEWKLGFFTTVLTPTPACVGFPRQFLDACRVSYSSNPF